MEFWFLSTVSRLYLALMFNHGIGDVKYFLLRFMRGCERKTVLGSYFFDTSGIMLGSDWVFSVLALSASVGLQLGFDVDFHVCCVYALARFRILEGTLTLVT